MIEILILVAIAGSALAGLWDLKTTEVPDEIPALMITLALFLLFVEAAMTGDFYPLFVSLVAGTAVLLLGLLNYKRGGWGAADAWIFAAIVYAVPFFNNRLFVADFFMNFLIVSALYTVAYSVAVGMGNRQVFAKAAETAKARAKLVVGVPVVFSAIITFSLALKGAAGLFVPLVSFLAVLLAMLFWAYAKSVEKYVFRRRIPAGKLKAGDVLEEMVWKGLTKEEVEKIKKTKKFVFVKEGIRFVPVFPITLVATLLWGNLMLLLLPV